MITHCPHCGKKLVKRQPQGDLITPRAGLTADELRQQAGLTWAQFEALKEVRLIVPDSSKGGYRPKLVNWAKKLAYLLDNGWTVEEIKQWSQERWQSDNPKQWPPAKPQD